MKKQYGSDRCNLKQNFVFAVTDLFHGVMLMLHIYAEPGVMGSILDETLN